MAKGEYKAEEHKAAAQARAGQSAQQTFTARDLDPMMDIRKKGFRESLWVPPYDRARPIYLWVDVTGSNIDVARFLANDPRGLAGVVRGISPYMEHPQIACGAISDNRCGGPVPLQVGHIEGEGHMMDHWLLATYLAGGGGGNGAESYELGMYVAARMTRADCFAHGLKGYNVIIGDDGWFPEVRAIDVQEFCGERIDADIPTPEIVAELDRNWNTFFILPSSKHRDTRVHNQWTNLLGHRAVVCENQEDISVVIPGLIGITEGTLTDLDAYDALMLTELHRPDPADRARVIATLAAYRDAIQPQ